MPLSEQEQRLLEEMERSLYHNDADYVASVGAPRGRASYRMIAIGVLVAVAGVAVIVTGVVLRQPLVGIAGFIVMFVGVLLALSSPRSADSSSPSGSAHQPKAGFMDRMNERWEKRQDEQDR